MNLRSIISRMPFAIQHRYTLRAMIKCIAALEKAGCRPFLAYGTALAVMRNNTIRFSHDPDCDIGVMAEDWNPAVKNTLQSLGFKLEHEFGTPDFGYELSYRKHDVKIDIFLFYKSKQKVWNCLWDLPDGEGIRKPIFHTYPPSLFAHRTYVKIQRNAFPVLDLLEQYAEHVYGKDWRIPVKQWDWRTDHHCLDKHFDPDES